jgi:hypothetical protein
MDASVSPLPRRLMASALIVGQFPLPAELHTGCHGAFPAFPRALPDQFALELNNGGEQG